MMTDLQLRAELIQIQVEDLILHAKSELVTLSGTRNYWEADYIAVMPAKYFEDLLTVVTSLTDLTHDFIKELNNG